MKSLAFLAAAGFVALAISGCMGGDKEPTYTPRTRSFSMVVGSGLDKTIHVYEKNDGDQQPVVWIGFKDEPDSPDAMPNPEIRVKEGDTVILTIQNDNALPHTFHLHGGLIPWEEDGVDYLTQMPIMPGESRTYTFKNMKAGTYWYHCHVDGAHHIDLGMYGAFIVEEVAPKIPFTRDYTVILDETDTCHVHGNTNLTDAERTPNVAQSLTCLYTYILDNLAQNRVTQSVGGQVPQPASDTACPVIESLPEGDATQKELKAQLLIAAGCTGDHVHGEPALAQTPRDWWFETPIVYVPKYNTYLVNGHAFPDTPVFGVKQGETVNFRLINAGNQLHTWHLHGHTMLVTHKDGYPLTGGAQPMDTIAIAPGERYDFVIEANNPGLWMVHDQNGLATMNDDQHPGGMMACVAYDGFHGFDAFAATRALDCNTFAVENILGGHQHG